ncbi:MAG: amino acid adenylation domain-containing protein [Rhizonema sp. PD37]|nr:amino acid adenylation domain-containing protein [Rhizonema sp. PD37]
MQNKQNIEGFRLSPQQKYLWLLQNDSFAYRTQCIIYIEGFLKVEILKETLQKVVGRHEILRTNFNRRAGIKFPIQVIAENNTLLWNNINLSELSTEKKSVCIQENFQDEMHFEFDFEQGSLFRSSLLILSETQHFLLITLPSLCADSWSLKNLVQEISNCYVAYLKSEELSDEPAQYIQFSEWQNELLEEEDAKTGIAYWHKQDFWSRSALNLPFENKFNEQTKFSPDVYALKIDSDLVAQIEASAPIHNTTIAEFLLVCWQTLLYRILKQSDIVISTVFSGRKYQDLNAMIGLIAKWIPTRCTFQDNFKFSEILWQTKETLRNNAKWQEYFIREESTETAVNVVNFPISFEFEEWCAKYCVDELSFSLDKQYVCFDRFKVKLSCIRSKELLLAEFHYDANLFSLEDIKRLAEQFLTLAESAANKPDATVNELEILKRSQRQQLLVEFNNTQVNYPLNKCIHQLFEEQVEQTPNNIAVVFEDQKLTYSELNARVNQLAHYLQRLGVGPEVLVGIRLERSLLTIIAILGILKAGGAYLPLDPALPAEGLALRMQDAQARVLLTQQSLIETFRNSVIQAVCLDGDWEVIAQESAANPTSDVTSKNLVYVLFTSGSTGTPKGVAVEHQQLLNYLYAILDKLNLPTNASFATVSTFAADLGNTVIFPALYTGGCLHVVSQERVSDPVAFGDYCNSYPIDYLKIVPSHLAALLEGSPQESILPRQCLILGGEAVSWKLIKQIKQYNPNCQILNHYGPTETTVGVTTFTIPDQPASNDEKTVPLGRPLANMQIYVLDKQLKPVPIGVPGELYIGGAGLARGYLNRPELTAQRFMTNPFSQENGVRLYKTGDLVRYLNDGNLEFLGRVDNQVKIRGFRIELGEIEALLSQHPGVRQCVVSVWEEQPRNKRLAAYFVPNKKQTPSVSDLRSFLKEKLVEYMVPSTFIMLKALPLTPNGKIDRLSLPAPDQARPELEETFVAPSTEIEQTIATIWQEMLHVEKVGINDNFFELGGHSLLLVQVHSKLREVLKREVLITDLFKHPTIGLLANYFSQEQSEKTDFELTQNQVEKRLASRKKRSELRQNV